MRGRLVGTTLLAVTLVSALTAAPFQLQKTALVTVVAEAGGPVASLTANDFVVREDRATRQVVAAERSAEPIFVTLLVDTLAPPLGAPAGAVGFSQTQDLRRALTSFVTAIKGGSPDAQIAVMEYAGAAVTVLDFTSSATEMDRYIQRLFPNRQADGVVIEALVEAAKKLSDKPTPRRAIVSIDFNSRDSSAVHAMNQAAENTRKSGATVWTISVRRTSASSSNREEVLNVVTRASGGMRLTTVEATGLESMLKSVANSLLSQYTVTFTRPANAEVKSTEMETSKGGKVLLTPWMR
jgi:von Willebrand factor type A domain